MWWFTFKRCFFLLHDYVSISGDLFKIYINPRSRGWMMWNFLVSGLSVGSTLVLYDGSPLRDPGYLWKLVDDIGITIFGTSAKYLDQLSVCALIVCWSELTTKYVQKVYHPREHHSLTCLRHIYSTGSPLASPLFDFVYRFIHPDVLLGSITGALISWSWLLLDWSLIVTKAVQIYAPSLPACAPHCQSIAVKSNVAC